MARKIITTGTLEAKRLYTSKKTGERFYYYNVLVVGEDVAEGELPESATLLSVPFTATAEHDYNFPVHSLVELRGEMGSFRGPDGKETLTERYSGMALLESSLPVKGKQ